MEINGKEIMNCKYDPVKNSIHIAGAFAQGDMYNSKMSDEELLATLGRVIGHEISHAFDSMGAQFDKDGNMKKWWTKEDYAAFRARNDKMIAYFKTRKKKWLLSYCPFTLSSPSVV